MVCISCWAPHWRTVLQNGQDKTPKASLKKHSIMEYLPGVLQDTKPLRSCSENEWRYFSKVILESNVTPNMTRLSDSFSTVPPIVNGCDCWCIVCDLEIIILSLTYIQLHPTKVTPCTDLDGVMAHGLCYSNSDTFGWHNSYKSGVIDMTNQLILQSGKKAPMGTGWTITG